MCCLPDTTSSARYESYDRPYLKQAFEAAGLSSDQFKIDNAQGSATTMQTQADADITNGASVLILDALDSGSGAAIEASAKAKGVAVIDYDRLTQGGPADRIYVSFDNVNVGKFIGKGEVDCIKAWKVKKPNILVMDGDRHRQQRQAVRAGLQQRAEAVLRQRQLCEGRRARRHVDARGHGHQLHAAVHGAPQHQCGRSRRTTTTPTQ